MITQKSVTSYNRLQLQILITPASLQQSSNLAQLISLMNYDSATAQIPFMLNFAHFCNVYSVLSLMGKKGKYCGVPPTSCLLPK